MEQLQPPPLTEKDCLRSSKRNGTIMNLVRAPAQLSRSRSNSATNATTFLSSPLSQGSKQGSKRDSRFIPSLTTKRFPTPSCLTAPTDTPTSTDSSPSPPVTSPTSPLSHLKPPRRSTGTQRNINYRHTMYCPTTGGYQDRGLARELEKLRLDTPRLSFETDTDSDRHSLVDSTFATDDFTDLSSTNSEVRLSTDSLTPSELDQIASDRRAEMTLEEALLATSDELHDYNERDSTTGSPTNVTESSSLTVVPTVTVTPTTTPHSTSPVKPQPSEDPKTYLQYLESNFNKDELGSLLSKNDEFHNQVLNTFLGSLELTDVPIDMALRNLVSILYLPKEGQQIDRIITVFSKRYFEANPGLFSSEDVVYSLTFSLLLLHTDAHNKLVKNKMTKEEYLKQTRQLDNSSSIPEEILEILYDNITNVEFLHTDEEPITSSSASFTESGKKSWRQKFQEVNQKATDKKARTFVGQFDSELKVSSLISSHVPDQIPYSYISSQNAFSDPNLRTPFTIRVKGLLPFFQHSDKPRPVSGFSISQVDETGDISDLRCLKEGLVLRKSDINEFGKKTHLRAWREFWAVLAGSQLILFKEVSVMRMRQRLKSDSLPVPKPYSVTSVANVIAVIDHEYTKHDNVFRFATSDGRQYLFRVDSKSDMEEWLTKLNFNAAFKSADVLPRGVSPQVFAKWRKGLPRIKNFDFEVDDQEELRGRVIRSRISQLEGKIRAEEQRIDAQKRLLKQLGIMVVLTKTARDHTLIALDRIKSRIRRYYLDLQRYTCYRETLLQDLALTTLSQPPPSPHSPTSHTLPFDL